MTDAELLAAIVGNPTLKQHAINGEDGTIARALTKPSTATPLTVNGLLGLLSPSSMAKLATNPNAVELRNQIAAQDIESVKSWATLFKGGSVITAGEHTAVISACNAAQPNSVTVTADDVIRVVKPYRGTWVGNPSMFDGVK